MIFINTNLAIDFRHSRFDHNHELGFRQPRTTICEIVHFIDGERTVVSRGRSVCHPLDNFNKEFGRKNSLTRAVARLPRADRMRFWRAYNNR